MLEPLSLKALSVLLRADYQPFSWAEAEALRIHQVGTDTRADLSGGLFVALKGPRFDGHDYLQQAQQAGALAALVERPVESELPQLCVDSTLQSLTQLASHQRDAFTGQLVAITGNSGKTSVKTLLAALLNAEQGPVLATQGNLNNHIGVPLTLCRLTPQNPWAVIELGANHLGEIDALARWVRPHLAIITNVTGAHLGEFGSMQAIAQAKGELLDHRAPGGEAILNAEDTFFPEWKRRAGGSCLSFGLQRGDVHCQSWHLDSLGQPHFQLNSPWGQMPMFLPWPGQHNIANALAAIAAAGLAGVSLDSMRETLANLPSVEGRLRRLPGPKGSQILDDSYNASPGAVKAVIDLLAQLPGRRILVLGPLAELGELSPSIHQELGDYARQLQLDDLWVLQGDTDHSAQAFGPKARIFSDHASLAQALIQQLDANTTCLIKGSRSAKMDKIVQSLTSEA